MIKPRILCALLLVAALGASACGSVATPEWAAEAQATRVALAVTDEHLTAIAPTATPTFTPTVTLTPTLTPVAPTATPLPTETPTPLPPTAMPTPEAADPIAVALAAGDPTRGQAAFQAQHPLPDGSSWACMSCHSVDPSGVRLIGPGLWNIVDIAPSRGTGEDAVTYIRHSILHPADFIAPVGEGEAPWALNMPPGWDQALSEQELNDIIAYLVTLR
jgi:mono/diheme cytochrome c family protein